MNFNSDQKYFLAIVALTAALFLVVTFMSRDLKRQSYMETVWRAERVVDE